MIAGDWLKYMLKHTLETMRNFIESRLQNGSPKSDFLMVLGSLGWEVPKGAPMDPPSTP